MIIGLLEEYGKFKNLCVLILFLLNTGETRTIYEWSDNVSIMRGSDKMILLEKFLGLFTQLSRGEENN